jgi:ketosteroid isomerase-like protein
MPEMSTTPDLVERWRQAAEAAYRGWDTFRAEDGDLRDRGDRVLWSGRLEGRGRIRGTPVSAPLDILYELRDGKVTQMRSFLDHDEALKAVGLE